MAVSVGIWVFEQDRDHRAHQAFCGLVPTNPVRLNSMFRGWCGIANIGTWSNERRTFNRHTNRLSQEQRIKFTAWFETDGIRGDRQRDSAREVKECRRSQLSVIKHRPQVDRKPDAEI